MFFSYSNVMANEEAKYDVVKSNEIYEIRKYSDRLAVQALNTNQNNSFRKLFNYICLLYTSPSPRDATLARVAGWG